jgi:membrane protein YdbS with pleckstrin-like domain
MFVVKGKTSSGYPILFSIMLGIVLTLLITIVSAVLVFLKFSSNSIMLAQTGALMVIAMMFTVYMTSKGIHLKCLVLTDNQDGTLTVK